jgi:hypothetical protein
MSNPPDAYRESDDAIIAKLMAQAQGPALPRSLPLDRDTMTQLALLPEFTPELLAETGIDEKIPGRATDVLADAAFFDSRPALPADDGSPRSVYWVRRDARLTIGSQVRSQLGLKRLRGLLSELRERVGTARVVDFGLDAWAEVVDLLIRDPEGKAILDKVAGSAAHRASQLVEVIAFLADVLGGSLPWVADRARTLVAVKVRQDEAARALATYQKRPALESWIAAALSGGRWAIHLRGGGGVGKTMLLRYVSSPQFAKKHDVTPFTVAGVDFDHLDPRYPLLRPLLLFEALQSQLVYPTSVSTDELGRARDKFLDAAAAAAELAASTRPGQRNPVADGIRAFADLVRLTGNQVVLFFDTAEELDKVAGATSDSSPVEATLKRLDELQEALRHRGQPPVRVIFAGRRPLRTRPDGADATPGYISVRPVEGFDRAEAVTYLHGRIPGITVEQVETLLDRSGPARGGEQRFNPFELASWASWVIDEQEAGRPFDRNLLASYADPYVQRRILGRISEPAVRVLVAPAALLGRFARRLIEPTARRAGFDQDLAVKALADQEWVNVVSRDDAGFPLTLEVDEHLQDRLRAAVMEKSFAFPLDRRGLADDIRADIRALRLVDQPADPFVALTRLLTPDSAVEFWGELEQRVAQEDAWGWADGLIRRVEPAVAAGTPLLAAITATKAAVAARQPKGAADASALWRKVIAMVPAGPATGSRAVLLARARLALVGQGIEPTADDVRIAPVGSVAGAVAVVLGDGGDLWRRAAESRWFLVATRRLDSEGGYVGSLLVTLGRTRARDVTSLVRTVQRLIEPRPPAESATWVDWTPPACLVERCALAVISWTRVSDPQTWGTTGMVQNLLELVAGRARERLRDIDVERFTAAYLLRRLLAGAVDSGELAAYDSAERAAYTPDRRPTWELHRTTPRLVDVVALGWAGLGAPERAEDILRHRIEQAVQAGTDPDAVADAQAALVRLFREYRVAPSSWSLGDLQAAGLAETEQAIRLIGEGPKGSRVPGDVARSARQDGAESPVVTLGHVVPALRRLEIEALDQPESTASELFELARDPSGGQEVRADMAYVLGVLACARAGIPVPGDLREWRGRSEAIKDPSPLPGKWGAGWTRRLQVARAYASGDDQAARSLAAGSLSPELALAPSPAENESTVMTERRRLAHVKLKPWKTPTVYLVLVAAYLVVCGAILGLTNLPLWALLAIALAATASGYVLTRLLESRNGVAEAFARRVQFSVEDPGTGPAASIKVSAGSRPYRLRRMSSRAASFYSAFPRRGGRPATVSLAADQDQAGRFTPARWRVPRSTLLSSLVIAELDVPPALRTLPWERWFAATSRSKTDTFIWIRPGPSWPEAVPPQGTPLFGGPDHMANHKTARFAPPVSGLLSSLAAQEASHLRNARLVHIVGTPVQTSAGWRLRVEGGGSGREASGPPASTRRQGLVAPTDLVADGAGVVVLQASPTTAGPMPFVADREGWFAFAADVLEAGAASVLTVPPLGDEQAEQAVDLTTDWALGTPDDLQPIHVVRLLKDLTRLVASKAEHDGPRPWVQDDVTGFIRLLDEGGRGPATA